MNDRLVQNPANYNWDRIVLLSPNAINFLADLVRDYYPEPWEVSLREKIMEQLLNNASVTKNSSETEKPDVKR